MIVLLMFVGCAYAPSTNLTSEETLKLTLLVEKEKSAALALQVARYELSETFQQICEKHGLDPAKTRAAENYTKLVEEENETTSN